MAKHRPFTTLLWVTGLVLAVCVGGGAAIRYLIPLATYSVASRSGEPNLRVGEVVLVDSPRAFCRIESPHPGQLVVHRKNGVIYLKRLIAGPGATVQMKGGRLFLDGQPASTTPLGADPAEAQSQLLRETLPDGVSYIVRDMGPSQFDNTEPVKVPEGYWFLLGDNRDNSADSRVNGPVALEDICGAVRSIFTSPDAKRVGLKL
jgi:signal peptidase I